MDKIYDKISSNQIISLFSNRPYLYFSFSVFFSQVAYNMFNVVLIFLIYFLTSSNFSVSILLFMILIPQILISFFGGVLADIVNKRKILIIGNLLRALIIIILLFNFDSPYIIYFVTFVVSAITQFYVPAESPLIPALVTRDKLVGANSIFGISLFGSVLIGYVGAGPIVSALGRADVFLVIAVGFVIAAGFAALIPSTQTTEHTENVDTDYVRRSIRSEFKESFMLLHKTRVVKDAFFLLIFSQIVIFILATLIPGYAKNILEVPAEDLSIIIFAPAAVGMIISALSTGSIFAKTSKDKLMSIGVFMSGAVLFLLPFASRIFSQGIIHLINLFLPHVFQLNVFNFVLILAFFAGFANALIFIPSQAILQEVIPENYRSKIYGLLFSLIGVFSLIPIMVAGGVADFFGVGKVFVCIGAAIILIGLMREKIIHSIVRFILRRES